MHQLKPFLCLLLFSSFSLSIPTSVALADWPEFRGPNQNGTLSVQPNAPLNLPTEWADDDPTANTQAKNILWKATTEGLGWSSPVIVANYIYITSARSSSTNSDPKDISGPQSLYVSCYKLSDGSLVFDKKIFEQPQDAPAIHKKNSHASPTILAHRPPSSRLTRLYVHFGHQGTACLSTQGDILWTNTEHNYPPVHGNGSSPIAYQHKIILTIDGAESPYTLALDAVTGKEIWRTPRDVKTDRSFSFATPQAIVVNGKTQIISPGADIVQALDPDSGTVLWFVRYSGYSLIVRPIYHQGLVFISTGYNTPKLLAIDPTGQGDVTDSHVRWTTTSGVPNTPSLTPMNNQIVMVSDGGVATGLKTSDGTKLWQKRLGGNFSASPLAVGNRIYFQNEAGEAIIMELPSDENSPPNELARNTLPGRIFASYAVDQNDLIIRTEQALYRISNSTTP